MKLKKWLKNVNTIGLTIVVWDADSPEEEGPLYEGNAFDLPWWIAEAKLSKKELGDEPIDFRESLGPEYNNKPGVVIIVDFEEA